MPTQVFTQGECEDARYWFPCMDYPAERATSELLFTMPEYWISVAEGESIAETVVDGRRWLKLTLLNPMAGVEDVMSVVEGIVAAADDLLGEEAA